MRTALELYRTYDATRAAALYRELIAREPRQGQAFPGCRAATAPDRVSERAVELLERAARALGESPTLYTSMGEACRRMGRLTEAALLFRRAIHLQPDFAEAHYHLGAALESLDDLERSAECYRAALSHRPTLEPAERRLESVLRKLRRVPLTPSAFVNQDQPRRSPANASSHRARCQER